MMPPKKFYAVAKGRNPGIYDNWPEAREQTEGFAGAVYKCFPSLREAREWMKNPSSSATPDQSSKRVKNILPHGPLSGDCVIIYTDGSSSGNPGPGGYGIVQLYKGEKKELAGGFSLTTNNRMELMAVIVALRELEYRNVPVMLYTDSNYVVNGINKGWAQKWRNNNWIKPDKQPALNPDLWSELLDIIKPLEITFVWIKGHAGNIFNERCDELAVSYSRNKNLHEDRGYNQ